MTHGIAPTKILKRVDYRQEPERVVRLWDAGYATRAREYGTLLMCEIEFLELARPPVLRRTDLLRIFGRIPGTQNPPRIEQREFRELAELARASVWERS